jgi:lipopolysaccharide export LptBFGC system permease protein LptF
MAKAKKLQKTIHFDDDVVSALEKQMKVSHNSNYSAMVNDGLRYAMFPEHRSDREADLVKLNQQFSASLAQHRKKTARDMALLQEMVLQMMKTFYMHNTPISKGDQLAAETQANARLDDFMEGIVRNMSGLKPITDRLEKGE